MVVSLGVVLRLVHLRQICLMVCVVLFFVCEADGQNTGTYTKSSINAAIASILGANYVGTAPGLDVLSTTKPIFQNGLAAAFGTSSGGTDEVPFAYLNYIIYDHSFNYLGGDRKRVTASAGFDPGNEAFSSHAQVTMPTINITEPGYIYVFVSNESENAEVWFDDLHVDQVKSSIVAGADYYPFGLPMENRQATREAYRYGYQGQYSELEAETGWNSFELRMYDARIGRWINPDPYGQFFSPYLAMANNPVLFGDPDGGLTGGAVDGLLRDMVSDATKRFTFEMVMRASKILPEQFVFASASAFVLREDLGPWMAFHAKGMANYAISGKFFKDLERTLGSQGTTKLAASINKGFYGMAAPKWDGEYDRTAQTIGVAANLATTFGGMRGGTAPMGTPSAVPVSSNPVAIPVTQPVVVPTPTVLDENASVEANEANGSTEANRAGQQKHREYKADDVLDGVRIKEFRLPSGNKIDLLI